MVTNTSAETFILYWIILVSTVSTVLSESVKAKKGQNVTLRCQAKKPLNWLNEDGETIGRQKGRIQQNVYGDLVIKSVRYSDVGVYTCSSVDGTIHNSEKLEISGPPTLVNITRLVDVEKNKEAVMTCLAEGYPVPTITWFMYEKEQIERIAVGNTLNVRIPCQYCQVYFLCKAENRFGEDVVNITANVVGKPDVTVPENVITGSIGHNVTVPCTIKSNPSVQFVKWLKNGKLVVESNRRRINFELKDSHEIVITLSIEGLKKKDFDDYECIAINKYGNETQKIKIQLKSPKSDWKPGKNPRVSPLSASTEIVISSGGIQKETTKPKKQDHRPIRKETTTQSSEPASSSIGSACNNAWRQLATMIFLPIFICVSLLLS